MKGETNRLATAANLPVPLDSTALTKCFYHIANVISQETGQTLRLILCLTLAEHHQTANKKQ